MALADELRKLQELRDEGSLSDAEFALAKAAVLANARSASGSAPPAPRAGDALGEAAKTLAETAKTWVTFQILAWIVGLAIGAFIFAICLTGWHRAQDRQDRFQKDFDKKWNSFDEPGK